jgi:LPS-assembly lipoprotein
MCLARNILFLICFLTLTNCGFKPLYGGEKHAHQISAFNSIYIENIPNSSGVFLKNKLIDSFYTDGRPLNPRYILSVEKLRERRSALDITKSADATRAQLKLETEITLKDKESGRVLLQRDLISITSYNILQSQFTTHVSEENARKNALTVMSQQIRTALSLYFNQGS